MHEKRSERSKRLIGDKPLHSLYRSGFEKEFNSLVKTISRSLIYNPSTELRKDFDSIDKATKRGDHSKLNSINEVVETLTHISKQLIQEFSANNKTGDVVHAKFITISQKLKPILLGMLPEVFSLPEKKLVLNNAGAEVIAIELLRRTLANRELMAQDFELLISFALLRQKLLENESFAKQITENAITKLTKHLQEHEVPSAEQKAKELIITLFSHFISDARVVSLTEVDYAAKTKNI